MSATLASPAKVKQNHKRFVLVVLAVLLGTILLPTAIGLFSAPSGTFYIGYPFNTDDHMVYAAWIRQAAEGHFFFENRFTLDPQPGRTVHLFYLVLGWISIVTGTLGATVLAQVVLASVFVLLLDDTIRRRISDPTTQKLVLVVTLFGAGLGFLYFHTFGVAMSASEGVIGGATLLWQLPTDVWQPEGFVYSSLLTNALFAWALVLIVFILRSILLAKESRSAVLPGAIAMGLLGNTHSYDAALLGFILIAFLATTISHRTLTKEWAIRGVLIAAGVIPAAIWLAYVLKIDPVFGARAATPTPSANFRPLLFGYLPLFLLGFVALLPRLSDPKRVRQWGGLALYVALLAVMFSSSGQLSPEYWWGLGPFAIAFLVAIVATVLVSTGDAFRDLAVAWAFVGVVAIYAPVDFQRKLTMGLSVPWAILAAVGVARAIRHVPSTTRPLVAALAVILLSATSLRWLGRQLELIRTNVANTTTQAIFLPDEVSRIIQTLRPLGREATFIAPPGIPASSVSPDGIPIPGHFVTPIVSDLNPVLVGFSGARAYAGHWSETPEYGQRRGELSRLYYGRDRNGAALEAFARANGIRYVVLTVDDPQTGEEDTRLTGFGEEILRGSQFRLVRIAD